MRMISKGTMAALPVDGSFQFPATTSLMSAFQSVMRAHFAAKASSLAFQSRMAG